MDVQMLVEQMTDYLWGWPFLLYVLGISVICTIALYGIQFRYFFYAWKQIFCPRKSAGAQEGKADMTPLQAFINTLSANVGNATLSGPAAALYSGGPGALLWMVIIGMLLMSVRFAEVYLSVYFGSKEHASSTLGGPMLYLQKVIAGRFLSYAYAVVLLVFGLLIGNSLQAHSISYSLHKTWSVPLVVTAVVLLGFIVYVALGGAERISKMSEKIVPLKVGVFIVSTLVVLIYHYASILSALGLIVKSAFTPTALVGGAIGFSVQQAIRYGIGRSIMATESGLGSAAIMFGSTGSILPMRDAMMSMISTFISTMVCFVVGLCIVASGVWSSGLTSTPLVIDAFNTVFGAYGGWVVSFLSIAFGIGVLVAFIYIGQEVWFFLTRGRYRLAYIIIYGIFSFFGALVNAQLVFSCGDIAVGFLLLINLFGIAYLLPVIRKGVLEFMRTQK